MEVEEVGDAYAQGTSRGHLVVMNDDFPEIPFGDRDVYFACWEWIDRCFLDDVFVTVDSKFLMLLGGLLKEQFEVIEPYFCKITVRKCSRCLHHCCVNRHGFPDFEDMIVRRAMGLGILEYDFSVSDVEVCQFLEKEGCRLTRYERSYRCSWYFCDAVFDCFNQDDALGFAGFQLQMSLLGLIRQCILRGFSEAEVFPEMFK